MRLLQGALGETTSSWHNGGLGWMKTFCKLCQGCPALAPAAQGSGGVTVPGSVQTTCGGGTWGHGLVVNVVVVPGWWLDFITLEGFSNLTAVIPWEGTISAGQAPWFLGWGWGRTDTPGGGSVGGFFRKCFWNHILLVEGAHKTLLALHRLCSSLSPFFTNTNF